MHLLSASLGPHVPQRPLLFYLCLCIPLCLLFSAFLHMFLLPSVSSLLLLHLLFSYLHASYASLFLFFPDCLIPHHLSFLSPASISSFPTSCISLFLSSSLPPFAPLCPPPAIGLFLRNCLYICSCLLSYLSSLCLPP